MNPSDIATILTAAAPIVASIASGISANKPEDSQKTVAPEKTVNVTINNHFYTNSEADAIKAANQISNQAVGCLVKAENPYII